MIFDFIIASLLIFISGFIGKIADAHNEHGLTIMKSYTIFFGITWGGIWFYLIGYSQSFYVTLIALLFYWIYKVKFDFFNHTIALIVILFGILLAPFNSKENIIQIAVLFGIYFFFDYCKKFKKLRNFGFLGILSVPFLYSIYIENILPISIIFFFFGVKSMLYFFQIKQNFLER